jgi:hypothetical protein
MDRLSRETRIRYWGGVARNRIRTIGIHRQYRIRVCKECGEMLRVYDGDHDSHGNYVRYIQDNPVLTFAHHFDEVRTAFLRYKADLRMEGIDIAGFAAMIPQAVSTLEIGLPTNNDILLDGPFDEPDEVFLSRQRNAIGQDMT